MTGILYLMACAVPAAAADGWWNAEWAFRQRVSLYTAELAEDLVDFPVTLLLDDGMFARSRAQVDGHDLRAVAPDGSPLDFEIVRWSPAGVEVNVFMPKIVAGVANQFFDLYYGNPKAVALPPKPHWDAHYRMVMHLNGNLDDDARGGVGATAEGKVAIGDVARFQGDPAFLHVAPERLAGLGQQRPSTQTLASGRRLDDRVEWFNFGLKTPRTVHTNAMSNGQGAPELNPEGIAPGEWHAAIVVYDARNHTRTICIDGTVLERDSALPGPLEIQEMRIGRGVLHFDPWQFTGAMDEVRLSDVARADGWIRAEAACL
ncbi:MAG: hypothetical protein NTU83_08515, partial [Candidatus Hydrogenedentes bacterium]|nr:hypothetical protein [Candidatus Hydrogenedentota bacterium]